MHKTGACQVPSLVTVLCRVVSSGMAQGMFLVHGVWLEVDHEDVQRLQQTALLQHVSIIIPVCICKGGINANKLNLLSY